jgi:hypothetical protein
MSLTLARLASGANRAVRLVLTHYPADIVGKAQRAQNAARNSGYLGIAGWYRET